MLFERVEKFYDEFEKVLSLARRKGQRIGSAFFSLPLYGEVTTVVGEGQTGMGKTLSYLVPIAMYRSGVLPEVPSFILKHGNNLFLEKKSLEDIIVEHDLIEESDTILKNTKTPVLGKIYILTATKMLQNQIINNDLEKVNKFLKEKNLLPISHMVLIGKKNYICLSNVENLVEKVSEIESEVENELEEAVKSSNNVLLEELKNQIKVVREVKRKLSTILQERISTFDELLKFFKRRELEVLGEEIEEVLEWGKIRSIRQSAFEIISPPFFFYKDKAMFYVHEVTSINEFISFLKKGYSSIIRKGMVDELFSTEFFSKCRACVSEKKESCEFFKSIESLRRADVLITNYYYFAVVLSEILSGLKRTIQQMEKTIGLSVNKWGQNTLKKALLPYEE